MMRHWIWVAALAVAACGPNKQEQAAEHAAREGALAAGVAARQPAEPVAASGAVAAAVGSAVANIRTVSFACSDGSTLELRYAPRLNIAVLTMEGAAIELPEEAVDQGFRYAKDDISVYGEGTVSKVERAGAEPVECVLVPRE
jgi:hypothetical protein